MRIFFEVPLSRYDLNDFVCRKKKRQNKTRKQKQKQKQKQNKKTTKKKQPNKQFYHLLELYTDYLVASSGLSPFKRQFV